MSDEERYLDAKDRPTLDPHDVAATMADDQRMAEEGRPRGAVTTILEEADRLVCLAQQIAWERDQLRSEMALILEHCNDMDQPMFTDGNASIKTLIKFVRAAAQRGLR